MPPVSIFSYIFTVPESAIDEYGHVNNVIYVQWMQDAAIRHAESLTEYKPAENTGWFAREHRIEYLIPAYQGEEIEVRTWLTEVKLARVRRKYEFVHAENKKVIAKGETLWIYVNLTTGRPLPITAEMLALFPIVPEQNDPADAAS